MLARVRNGLHSDDDKQRGISGRTGKNGGGKERRGTGGLFIGERAKDGEVRVTGCVIWVWRTSNGIRPRCVANRGGREDGVSASDPFDTRVGGASYRSVESC